MEPVRVSCRYLRASAERNMRRRTMRCGLALVVVCTICVVTASATSAMVDPGPRRKGFARNETLGVLGVNLARFREHRDWTQEDLAHAAEVARSTVIRWETGQVEPLAEHRAALAKALRVRAGYRMTFLYVDPGLPVEEVLLK